MEEIWPKIRKWPPKLLEKHYLEKVFALRFHEHRKPYKTNGKLTISQWNKPDSDQNGYSRRYQPHIAIGVKRKQSRPSS